MLHSSSNIIFLKTNLLCVSGEENLNVAPFMTLNLTIVFHTQLPNYSYDSKLHVIPPLLDFGPIHSSRKL